MHLVHRTRAGLEILRGGFRDGHGTYLTDSERVGVWLSDVPLDVGQGAIGDSLLVVNMPERRIRRYEWVEEGKPYREFLIPASVVNRFPRRVARAADWRRLRPHHHGKRGIGDEPPTESALPPSAASRPQPASPARASASAALRPSASGVVRA
jgi:hypothetical protein